MSKKSHHHYQSLRLLPIAALLIITPLLSSSLRFKYLYFIVNILIIAVGAEAGLLSFLFLRSAEKKKTLINPQKYFSDKENRDADHRARSVEEKCKIFVDVKDDEKLLLSGSNPSIFFIEGGDQSENNITRADQEEFIMEDDDNDEELFRKAEIFIGNFYKELKMQREESRKKFV